MKIDPIVKEHIKNKIEELAREKIREIQRKIDEIVNRRKIIKWEIYKNECDPCIDALEKVLQHILKKYPDTSLMSEIYMEAGNKVPITKTKDVLKNEIPHLISDLIRYKENELIGLQKKIGEIQRQADSIYVDIILKLELANNANNKNIENLLNKIEF